MTATFIKFFRVRGKAGQIPMKAHQDDAGFDVAVAEEFTIFPGETKTAGLGVVAHFPEGTCGIIVGRSSLWHRYGLLLMPPISVIDSGYRGELTITLFSPANNIPRDFKVGDRLVQVLLLPVPRAEFLESYDLPTSTRGDNGYGSTGR